MGDDAQTNGAVGVLVVVVSVGGGDGGLAGGGGEGVMARFLAGHLRLVQGQQQGLPGEQGQRQQRG
jgi:hypothetical protein